MTWLSSLFPLTVGPGPVDDPGDPLIPPIEVDPNSVTPGVEGFIAIAVVTVLAILLIIDMSRRVRRVRYRGEVRERLEAERAAAQEDAESRPDDDGQDDDDGRPAT